MDGNFGQWWVWQFWISASLLFYTYVGYPLSVVLHGRWRKRKTACREVPWDSLPNVLVLMVVHNEEALLAGKLENLLASDYPLERLRILVALDGCADQSEAITARYRSLNVECRVFQKRRGKTSILNRILPTVAEEIVVFCDVRQSFDRTAILRLVENFSDPVVGAVTGELHLLSHDESATGTGTRLYWTYEKAIRRGESRLHSVLGVTGAIYALRRRLFVPISDEIILDDVLLPLQVVLQGYRIVFDSRAKAFDTVAKHARTEIRRKVRTLTGNFQAFRYLGPLLNPLRSPVAFQLFSHKLLRLLAPLFLLASFVANVVLSDSSFYRTLLFVQFAGYGLAALDLLFDEWIAGIGPPRLIFQLPAFFVLLNLAVVQAAYCYWTGSYTAWWPATSADGDPAVRREAVSSSRASNPPTAASNK